MFDNDEERLRVNLNQAMLIPFKPWFLESALLTSGVFSGGMQKERKEVREQDDDDDDDDDDSRSSSSEEDDSEEEGSKKGKPDVPLWTVRLHMSEKGGLEGLSSEERKKKKDEIMIESVNPSSKHQDRNATLYHPVTGEMKKTGLRVVVGFNDGPLNQTLSSGNGINQEGDLQNVNTVGWRVRMLVCLCLIFLSTFFLVFFN
jgi:hypothetical protein